MFPLPQTAESAPELASVPSTLDAPDKPATPQEKPVEEPPITKPSEGEEKVSEKAAAADVQS
jgi:hypothetical protein